MYKFKIIADYFKWHPTKRKEELLFYFNAASGASVRVFLKFTWDSYVFDLYILCISRTT